MSDTKAMTAKEMNLRITSLRSQAEEQMNLKNSLYSFILEQGLFFELRDYELTHDMSSVGCNKIAPPDPITEAQIEFETEKNIKNNLYAFIIDLGLFKKLKEYNRTSRHSIPGWTCQGYCRSRQGDLS